jgi:hypothetical protein
VLPLVLEAPHHVLDRGLCNIEQREVVLGALVHGSRSIEKYACARGRADTLYLSRHAFSRLQPARTPPSSDPVSSAPTSGFTRDKRTKISETLSARFLLIGGDMSTGAQGSAVV